MAKRKHHTKRRTPRRRRMSGTGMGHEFMEVVGLVVGNVAATIAQRQMTSMNPKIVSGGELVGGYMLKKHAKSPFMSGIAYGLMSAGAIGLTHEFGVIHGVEDFVSGMMDGGDGQGLIEGGEFVHGLSNESSVNGLRNQEFVSGAGERFDPVNDM